MLDEIVGLLSDFSPMILGKFQTDHPAENRLRIGIPEGGSRKIDIVAYDVSIAALEVAASMCTIALEHISERIESARRKAFYAQIITLVLNSGLFVALLTSTDRVIEILGSILVLLSSVLTAYAEFVQSGGPDGALTNTQKKLSKLCQQSNSLRLDLASLKHNMDEVERTERITATNEVCGEIAALYAMLRLPPLGQDLQNKILRQGMQ